MICGCGSQFGSERCTAEIVEFVSVDLERESQRPSFGQDLTRLFQGKCARLAENIYKGQSPPRSVSSHHSLSSGSIVSHTRSV